MPGLTAKVFRTYNASYTFATLLKDMKAEGTVAEKVKQYNDANRRVAILCNHKRTVTAGHANQMEKLGDRVCFCLPSMRKNTGLLTFTRSKVFAIRSGGSR
jgi:DNA topoisomerase I